MKNLLFFLSILLMTASQSLVAQVNKKVVAELFTNTRCSICGSKNPSLKQNLQNHPDVILLTVHPSSPYSSCVLHQHNSADNDGRTSFYNIYGATPRLVIQGEVAPGSTNFGDANLFSSYTGQSTAFSVFSREVRIGEDSVRAEVTIKAVSDHSEGMGSIFIAYVEDTLDYSAPNGESQHWHVLRDAFTLPEGESITLPSEGDSVTLSFTIPVRAEWDMDAMRIVTILQNQLKLVLQAGQSDEVATQSATGIDEANLYTHTLFPNPASSEVTVEEVTGSWSVVNLQGQTLLKGNNLPGTSVRFSVRDWPAGMYVFTSEVGMARFAVE